MPDQEQEASKERMQDPYDRAHFKYQPATNNYICSTGNKLEFKKRLNSYTRKQYANVYEGVSCNDCPVKPIVPWAQNVKIY